MPLNLDNSILPPLPDAPSSSIHQRYQDEAMSGDESQRTETENWFGQFMTDFKTHLSDERIHCILFDYLISEGYEQPALMLAEELGVDFASTTANIRSTTALSERNAIRAAVLDGHLDTAIELIERLCPQLLANFKSLTFDILRQKLVELIRVKDVEASLTFAQQHLVDRGEQSEEQLTKLEQTYALLAFDRPENSPFGALMSQSQRLILASQINAAILTALNSQSCSRLERLQQCIVWNRAQSSGPADLNVPLDRRLTHQVARELFGSKEDMADDLLEEALSP